MNKEIRIRVGSYRVCLAGMFGLLLSVGQPVVLAQNPRPVNPVAPPLAPALRAYEGGGQILRTALSLSIVTGESFRIEKIRAGRKKPGLLRQHLTAVQAAAKISGAKIEGADLGSQQLTFKPGKVQPGDYSFAVGTAGSATLVLQTILPALIIGSKPSTLTLEGGTHNPHAPPFDFLQKTFLPILNKMGSKVSAKLERPGFYPAGGW